ncbi:hypothetical protein IW262DRAFT_406961 [Armillaria fumosa]|nr:hypothetical protein IW262DRAFT_406961 [Armillaria fumosa]
MLYVIYLRATCLDDRPSLILFAPQNQPRRYLVEILRTPQTCSAIYYSHLKISKKRSEEMALHPKQPRSIKKRTITRWQHQHLRCSNRCHLSFSTDLRHPVLDDRRHRTRTRGSINTSSMLYTTPYIGHADQDLVQHLTDLNLKFRTYRPPRCSGKYCSIIQGAGVGKSRLLAEVRVTIIDLNLSHRSSATTDCLPLTETENGSSPIISCHSFSTSTMVPTSQKFHLEETHSQPESSAGCQLRLSLLETTSSSVQHSRAAPFTVVKSLTIVKDDYGRGVLYQLQATLRWNEQYSRSLSGNNEMRCIFFQDVKKHFTKRLVLICSSYIA